MPTKDKHLGYGLDLDFMSMETLGDRGNCLGIETRLFP